MKKASTALLIESVAGIAGDMFSAACADAGLISAANLTAVPDLLGFKGVSVELAPTTRAQLAATHLEVVFDDNCWERFLREHPPVAAKLAPKGDHLGEPSHHRPHAGNGAHDHVSIEAIELIFSRSRMSPKAVDVSIGIFRELARAEAVAHRIEPELVQFHEIGRIDSIVDVAMAGVCIAAVGPDKVFASPVKLGRGSIQVAHGHYPIPPPASANLCRGFPIDPVPHEIDRKDLELSTPTGLAILKALNPKFVDGWPGGRPIAHGYGAGSMELGRYPNVTRVSLFNLPDQSLEDTLPYRRGEVVEIVCNFDDQSPERTAWLLEKGLEKGALDMWISPVIGKKNRPAHQLSILAPIELEARLIDWLLRSSSTFGLRRRTWDRFELAREIEVRQTPYGELRYKIGMTTDGEVLKEKPEYEDLARIWKIDPNFRG